MALQVFNPNADEGRHAWRDYTWQDELPVLQLERGGPMQVQTVQLAPYTFRRWSWPAGLDEVQRATWLAFLEAVGFTRDCFLLLDPRDPVRELVATEPAVGDAARLVFSFPTNNALADYRWYPLAASVRAFVAGVETACTVQVDARTITFAAPPAGGATVRVTYQGLRLVRLVEAPELQSHPSSRSYATYQLDLQEVVRDER